MSKKLSEARQDTAWCPQIRVAIVLCYKIWTGPSQYVTLSGPLPVCEHNFKNWDCPCFSGHMATVVHSDVPLDVDGRHCGSGILCGCDPLIQLSIGFGIHGGLDTDLSWTIKAS